MTSFRILDLDLSESGSESLNRMKETNGVSCSTILHSIKVVSPVSVSLHFHSFTIDLIPQSGRVTVCAKGSGSKRGIARLQVDSLNYARIIGMGLGPGREIKSRDPHVGRAVV